MLHQNVCTVCQLRCVVKDKEEQHQTHHTAHHIMFECEYLVQHNFDIAWDTR